MRTHNLWKVGHMQNVNRYTFDFQIDLEVLYDAKHQAPNGHWVKETTIRGTI